MLTSRYIEDVFLAFSDLVFENKISVQPHDVSVIVNFSNVIGGSKGLTQNQGNFLLKILQKYQKISMLAGLNYVEALKDPSFKENFRILDLSKRIYVEQDCDNALWICLKFPYQLKKEFDSEFANEGKHFAWDHEEKIRKNRLYDTNLISLYEFVQKHSFEIDQSFMNALSQIEEIWQKEEQLIPHCIKINGQITLINASEEAQHYFNEKKTGNEVNDLILAKSMAFPFHGPVKTLAERAAAHSSNVFWMNDYQEYFNFINAVDGKIIILLDRTENRLQWLKNFAAKVDQALFPRHLVKICFREESGVRSDLNQWIKDNGFGGRIEEGKILIFHQKPAKWLFKDLESVKIVTTTSLYPSPNPMVRDFCNSHHCVIYLCDIRPSEKKDQSIVEL